jgi:hypothetical protein
MDVEAGLGFGAKGAGGEEEGIAREEGGDDQSCLSENDQKEDTVGPNPEVGYDLREVNIDVQDEVD